MKHLRRISIERPVEIPSRASESAKETFWNAVYRDTMDFIYQKLLLFFPRLDDFF